MPRPKGIKHPARFSVSLDDETHQELRARASREDVSIAWLIRRAIHEMIRRGQVDLVNKSKQPPTTYSGNRRLSSKQETRHDN